MQVLTWVAKASKKKNKMKTYEPCNVSLVLSYKPCLFSQIADDSANSKAARLANMSWLLETYTHADANTDINKIYPIPTQYLIHQVWIQYLIN